MDEDWRARAERAEADAALVREHLLDCTNDLQSAEARERSNWDLACLYADVKMAQDARIEALEGALRRLLEHKPEWCGWDDDVRESGARAALAPVAACTCPPDRLYDGHVVKRHAPDCSARERP